MSNSEAGVQRAAAVQERITEDAVEVQQVRERVQGSPLWVGHVMNEWLVARMQRLTAQHWLKIPRHVDGTQECACGIRCANHSRHVAEVQVRFMVQHLAATNPELGVDSAE